MKPAGPFTTIWANQWEPPGTESRQFAARCYAERFGEGSVVNEDINRVLEKAEAGETKIPDVDMVVGGFPCQDYSVARPLNQAHGIEGKKGVLWWDIYHFLEMKKPRFGLFENVDRLLKSPASQRGRDFAEDYRGERRVLGDVLVDESDVPEQFYIAEEKLPDWRYLKGAKREERTNKKTGFTYTYSEGAMSFPDSTEKPSRTILTGEGGTGASRFKHVIECSDGRFRRLVPDELDQLQGFPRAGPTPA